MAWKNTSWHYKLFFIISLLLVILNVLLVLTTPLWKDYFDYSLVIKFQQMFLIPITQFALIIMFVEFLTNSIQNLGKNTKKDIKSEYNLYGRFILLGISSVILIILSCLNIIEGISLIIWMFVLFVLSVIFGPVAGNTLRKIKGK